MSKLSLRLIRRCLRWKIYQRLSVFSFSSSHDSFLAKGQCLYFLGELNDAFECFDAGIELYGLYLPPNHLIADRECKIVQTLVVNQERSWWITKEWDVRSHRKSHLSLVSKGRSEGGGWQWSRNTALGWDRGCWKRSRSHELLYFRFFFCSLDFRGVVLLSRLCCVWFGHVRYCSWEFSWGCLP